MFCWGSPEALHYPSTKNLNSSKALKICTSTPNKIYAMLAAVFFIFPSKFSINSLFFMQFSCPKSKATHFQLQFPCPEISLPQCMATISCPEVCLPFCTCIFPCPEVWATNCTLTFPCLKSSLP